MVKQEQAQSNTVKRRMRSPEKKAQQFEKILEVGKQLFETSGRDGFTLSALAKKLDMNKNNLYNYIESKRELWIAIRKKCYEQYRDENRKIIKETSGTNVDVLLKIFEHFFEFAENDYAAFRIMHTIRSPPSDKVGPFEKEYKQFSFLDGTTRLIQKAIDNGEIKENNAALLSFFMFSLLLGSTMIEWAMRDIENTTDKEGKKIDEYLQFGSQKFTSKEFRKYTLQKIQKGFTEPNMAVNEFEYK
ncbi:MAG: TetR/AcrR family transcriptional regulator [Candidatus Lokiarchaeota archaeon]|nr:TetR/AcrR family transcriptional regulator [Candidatus Lokiarchaeota archaeon]